MIETHADLLRCAADRLENSPIEPGVTVRYAPDRKPGASTWMARVGRKYLVVTTSGDEMRVGVYVPIEAEDVCYGEIIWPEIGDVEVVVSEHDKALAAALRMAADNWEFGSGWGPQADVHMAAVARAVLGEEAS